jgi:plasmid replication initiation protein
MTDVKNKDKRHIAQMTLPVIYNEKDIKLYAKQHWNITFARQKKVSVYAKRIMANVMAMIKEDDLGLRKFYQMHISSVVPQTDSDFHAKVKKAFDELTDLKWMIEDIKTKYFSFRHLLDTTKTVANDGFECAYKDGTITIVLNPALEPYFIEIAHYTTYELKHYMHFSSWYSLRMFELLSAFKDTGIWWVSISEFRKLMDCEEKYPNPSDMIKKTLTEPLTELNETDLAFTFQTLEDANFRGRGRKPIIALEFKLNKVLLKEIPKEWFEYSDAHKQVLLRLRQWRVTDSNIIRYANSIGIEGANKLLYEWQLKGNQIENKEKYCNAVWVRVGKVALNTKS